MAERPERERGRQHGTRAGRGGNRRRVAAPGRGRSAQRPSQRSRSADPARSVAFAVLRATDDGAYANLELPRRLRTDRVSGRDAAFATELCYGTLRRRGWYDHIIAAAADRSTRDIDPPVLDALRMGAHQLLEMRVPSHAAVNATVALVRAEIGVGPSGFVNAVLRRIDERTPQEWADLLLPQIADPWERRAAQFSHPAWQVRALRAALLGHGAVAGAEQAVAELEALLTAHNTAPEVTLVARPGLGAEPEIRDAGALPHPAVPTAFELPGGDPGALAPVRDGRAAVQDAGSQAVALTLAAAELDGTDRHWLDLCAGPGGKAGLLAAVAIERGADLIANDVSEHRAELIRGTIRPVLELSHEAGPAVTVVTGDGREAASRWPEHFDRVLVDVPCTGLGALRRRPEARWRRTPADLADLAGLQRDLLTAAIEATRPGGVILYSTCSPHLAETTFVVDDVAKRRDDVVVDDVRPVLGSVLRAQADPQRWGREALGAGPTVQLWPHRHGTDGMFLALLRKVKP